MTSPQTPVAPSASSYPGSGGPVQPGRLITRAGTGAYRADPAPGALDKHKFEALLAAAAGVADLGQPEQETRLLEAAMESWPDPEIGFPDLPDSLRAREKTERLLEQPSLHDRDAAG